MLFNSIPFLVFFIIFFGLYLFTPLQYRLWLIILGSTAFYSYWNPYYVLLPHILTLIAYIGSIWLDKAVDSNRKVRMLTVVTALLLPLILIKYTNFLYNELFVYLFNLQAYSFNIALPLSLSFVTFTLLAYVIDIYRGRFQVEYRLPMLMGLVLFFPHLIAGPVLRPHDLLPQLKQPKIIRRHLFTRILFGIVLFSLGILKKVVFADQLSSCVDPVYAGADTFNALHYLLAIYAFSIQLYCDFSGYTDMAIGLAIMLGMRLPMNFAQPYMAASLVEFWRRWHITLSNWLRDYLYIALGGNKGRYDRQVINILITMSLGGLWHGANWTFLLWGFVHGVGIAFIHGFRKLKLSRYVTFIPHGVWVLITFHFVALAWVFFRAPDITTVGRIITGLFTLKTIDILSFCKANAFYIVLLIIFFMTHRFDSHKQIRRSIVKVPPVFLWVVITLIWIIAILFSTESSKNFIYFDF